MDVTELKGRQIGRLVCARECACVGFSALLHERLSREAPDRHRRSAPLRLIDFTFQGFLSFGINTAA